MKKILVLNIGLFFFSALHAQEKIVFGVEAGHSKTSDRAADSVRKLLITKDTSVKAPSPKKPYNQLPKKPADAIEFKRKH
ncbi:MAG TPA: hypothetical protein VK666_28640 [Chryseolinea sp.]|nr:hypothetical protein [Chryseolinea sp.]